MVLQTDIALCEKFFQPAPRYNGRKPEMANIYDYRGKHILEHHRPEGYMDRKEFREIMDAMGIKPYKNTWTYPIRLRKEYGELWKCM